MTYDDNGIGPSLGRIFGAKPDGSESGTAFLGIEAVELELSYFARAKVCELPNRDGFLIHVRTGGSQPGESSKVVLSLALRFDAALRPSLERFEFDPVGSRA